MFSAPVITDSEVIGNTLGDLEFYYYQYLDNYSRPPGDLEDLVSGVIYIELKNYFEKKAMKQNG